MGVSLKNMVCGIVAVVSLLCSASPALAGPFSGRNGGETGNQAGPAGSPSPPRESQRPHAQRNQESDRMQRLSPEERRALRRDIREAGREIYRPRR